MASEKKRAALFVILVFLCGSLSGAVAVNLWDRVRVSADAGAAAPSGVDVQGQRIPSTTRKRAVSWFAEELALGPEQSDQLAKILDETRAAYKDHEREIDEIRHEAHNRIRHILSDQQRTKFSELLAQRKAQRELRERQSKLSRK